jgi:TolB-like protein
MGNSLFAELKRRNVFRAAILYLGIVWALSQGAAQLLPVFDVPNWAVRWLIVAAVIGFPFWIAFAWFFEFTPEGWKRESEIDRSESITRHTGHKLDFAIIGVLVVAVVLLLTDRFVLRHGVNQAEVPEHSIAVLPFADMSQAKDQEYFSDGLSEELLDLLAKVPGLQVTGRTSSFSFKGKNEDLASIGHKLHVAHVLEGSVRKAGDRIRITTQLIKVADGYHLWSESYDRQLDDVFAVQDEIAAAVVQVLKLKLLPAHEPESNPQQAHPSDAHDQYLLGLQFFGQGTLEGWKRAVEAQGRAIALDPTYADAYAQLAMAEYAVTNELRVPSEIGEGKRRALVAADRAVALAPKRAEGYAARAYLRHVVSWDWTGSQADFDRALELEPGNARMYLPHSRLLLTLGRLPEATLAARKSVELEPLGAEAWHQLGRCLVASGEFAEARNALTRAVEISPKHFRVYTKLGEIALVQGDPALARKEFERADFPGSGWNEFGVAMSEYDLGHATESQRALDKVIAEHSYDGAYQIAEIYAWRREPDKAFEWLDRAYAQLDGGMTNVKLDPLLSRIRADPRYQDVLRKMRLPE